MRFVSDAENCYLIDDERLARGHNEDASIHVDDLSHTFLHPKIGPSDGFWYSVEIFVVRILSRTLYATAHRGA